MHRILSAVLLLLGTANCATAYADPLSLLVDDTSGNLGYVNITTGAVTLLGNAGVGLTDIAFSPTGKLYGVDFSNLYSLSTTNGHATFVGSLGGAVSNALVFSSSGTLYSAYTDLDTVNTATGAATRVGSLSPYGSSGDLAFVGGKLLLSTTSDQLVSLDPTTGKPTLIGDLGVSNVFGLASPNGVDLYAVAATSVYQVNPGTGAATFLVNYGGHGLGTAGGESFFTEAQAVPPPPTATPEPSSFILFGTGVTGIAGVLRRKFRLA